VLGSGYDYNAKKKAKEGRLTKAEKSALRKESSKKRKEKRKAGESDSESASSGSEASDAELDDFDSDSADLDGDGSEGQESDEVEVDDMQDKALHALGVWTKERYYSIVITWSLFLDRLIVCLPRSYYCFSSIRAFRGDSLHHSDACFIRTLPVADGRPKP
jgi:hypothetical protein